ncbi:MAG: response regulator [Bacteroidia bacterium]|nr:response regulator [Bacteroidia bacterium]
MIRKKRILYFEDNLLNQMVVIKKLRNSGFDIDIAGNSPDGIDMFVDNDYDLILMDIMMPEVDGFEVTRLIRALDKGKDLPIIVITADAYEINDEICKKNDINAFLVKPIDYNALSDLINKLMIPD